MWILGLVLIGMLGLLVCGVALLFVKRKPAGGAPPAPPAAPVGAPAPAYDPAPVLSHRQQVLRDERLAILAAYDEAEQKEFADQAVLKFRRLVKEPPVVATKAA